MPENRASLALPMGRGRGRCRTASTAGAAGWPLAAAALALLAGGLAFTPPAVAETCWAYADGTNALAPIKCVQKSDLTAACSYGSLSSPTDCTAIPAASAQTILDMHRVWHECFGAVGGANPPPGRGQRWYAFHRQFEFDYDAWRRGVGLGPIESLDWCPNMDMPYGTDPTPLPPAPPPPASPPPPPRPHP